MIKTLPLLLIFIALVNVSFAQEAEWSKPVNGLRARLFVLPPDKPDTPFCLIFLEIQNVSGVGGQIRIRFDPERLRVEVTDRKGTLLPKNNGVWDGGVPNWEPIALPWKGTIKFQISFPGAGYRPTDRMRVDMGPMQNWLIPRNGKIYFLSGKLTISPIKGDHPYLDWSGTIDLPSVKIPGNR